MTETEFNAKVRARELAADRLLAHLRGQGTFTFTQARDYAASLCVIRDASLTSFTDKVIKAMHRRGEIVRTGERGAMWTNKPVEVDKHAPYRRSAG